MRPAEESGTQWPEGQGNIPMDPMVVSRSESISLAEQDDVLETEDSVASLVYRSIFAKAAVGLAYMDAAGKFHHVNRAFCDIVGYTKAELTAPDFDWHRLFFSQDLNVERGSVTVPFSGEIENTFMPKRCQRKDGRSTWVDLAIRFLRDNAKGICGVVLTAVDTTEQKHNEETIRHHAFYDGLTQLPNRRLLLDRLQQAIARAHRVGNRVGLLFIDLDEFKPINDELGHAMGDWLLQEVSRTLVGCLRGYDSAARFGGDEFVVLLPNLAETEEALMIAERIRRTLELPFATEEGRSLNISASIGVVLFPDHADNDRGLLHVGDTAMYEAKRSGRNKIVCPERAGRGEAESDNVTLGDGQLLRLSWESKYASGDDTIDSEHRELFKQGNQVLDTAIRADVDPAAFKAALKRLLGLVAAHFHSEEGILKKRGYAKLAEHKAEHRELLERARTLRERSDEHGISTGDLVDFLIVELISKHILMEDRNYFSFVADPTEGPNPDFSEVES